MCPFFSVVYIFHWRFWQFEPSITSFWNIEYPKNLNMYLSSRIRGVCTISDEFNDRKITTMFFTGMICAIFPSFQWFLLHLKKNDAVVFWINACPISVVDTFHWNLKPQWPFQHIESSLYSGQFELYKNYKHKMTNLFTYINFVIPYRCYLIHYNVLTNL